MGKQKSDIAGQWCEWNTGSPGGWMYTRMVLDIYRDIIWPAVQEELRVNKIELELDFSDKLLNPHIGFAGILLRASEKKFPEKKPFIALVTEALPLPNEDDENSVMVRYLQESGNLSALVRFQDVKVDRGIKIFGKKPTVIYLDANLRDVLRQDNAKVAGVLEAIKQGYVVNPRSLEAIGDKNVFSCIWGEFRKEMSDTTLERTPETYLLTPENLEIAWQNRGQYIFKPRDGHSGVGFCFGADLQNFNQLSELAQDWNYIFQKRIPEEFSTLYHPALDVARQKVFMSKSQTDLRVLIGDHGFIGTFCRFARKAPVNVGAGGGGQAVVAITSGNYDPEHATRLINEAICKMPFEQVNELAIQAEKKAKALGFIYKNRGIPVCLTPKLLTQNQLKRMEIICENLWDDICMLHGAWLMRRMTDYIQIKREEVEYFLSAIWSKREPAIIAADCMFKF